MIPNAFYSFIVVIPSERVKFML